jgi:hypothetical protein
MKIITTGQIFFFQIINYQGFRNNQVKWYEFFLLGTQVQTKIQIIANFELTRFYRTNKLSLSMSGRNECQVKKKDFQIAATIHFHTLFI